MRRLRAFLIRLGGLLWHGSRPDRDIDDELRAHVEMLVDEQRRAGCDEAEARRLAYAAFGTVASAADAVRDRRGVPFLEHWLLDGRHAIRSLRRTPALSASMILVLALGIGLVTTVATAFHAVVWRPLPVPAADRVVKLALTFDGEVDRRVSGHVSHFSLPEIERLRAATRALAGVAGARHEGATWLRPSERRALTAALVTGTYFPVLQVRAVRGRLLGPADRDQPVAVISERLWTSAFGRDPAAIGASMQIDRLACTIVGVADRSFAGTETDIVDVWLPLEAAARARGEAERLVDDNLSWLQVVGRLAPGVSLAAATAEARAIATRFDASYPGRRTTIVVAEGSAFDAGLMPTAGRQVAGASAVVLLLTALPLLICASNAAGLLLARGVARRQDLALRIALGAGRGRIAQQVLAESVVVALVAAGLGLGLCSATLRVTAHLLPLSTYFESFVPDAAAIGFALAAAVVTSLLFGAAPALHASRVDPLPTLKQDGGGAGASAPTARTRHRLVSAQVAVALVLLVVSALFARAVRHAVRVDTGFPLRNLYAVTIGVPDGADADAERRAAVRRVGEALRQAGPSVRVGTAAIGPFSGHGMAGARPLHFAELVPVRFNQVDDGYFGVLGVAPVAGRLLAAQDAAAVVVVNARLARAFWHDERRAPGQVLLIPKDDRATMAATVVGVVPTLQSITAGIPDPPTYYTLRAADAPGGTFLVRSASPAVVDALVDDAIRGSSATRGIVSIEQRLSQQADPARAAAIGGVLVGLLALIVAGVGIYGIVVHAVAARTRELGVHVALGASRAQVLRLVLGSSLRAIGLGVAAGVVVVCLLALTASRALAPLLFGVPVLDPIAVLAALAFLSAVAFASAYLPARRALGAGPMDALRRS